MIAEAPLPTPPEDPQADPHVPAAKRDVEQAIPDGLFDLCISFNHFN